MNALAAFFERNIVAVYFIYGLAFFSMGLAVWLESGRASEFRIARVMGSLAGFGLLHGLHEWLEMFLRLGNATEINLVASLALGGLRVGLLALSFLLLMIFGARLIYSNDDEVDGGRVFVFSLAGMLFSVWLGSIFIMRRLFGPCPTECITAVDVLTRYMLGVPGALLAAWAMVLEQRAFRARGMPGFGRDLLWAALALFLYGVIGQTFPQRSFLFPSTIINSTLFLQLFGIPVQLFRAFAAGVVAVFVIRALRAFELESQQRLAAANEARLAAQRQALETQRRAQAETEQLNRELRAAVQDLSTLFELSRSLASTLDRDALLKQAIDKIVSRVPRIEAGLILYREKPEEPARVIASAGHESESGFGPDAATCLERARHLGEHVAKTSTPALCTEDRITPLDRVAELDAQPPAEQTASAGDWRAVGIPLETQAGVAGSLVLTVSPETPLLSERDISLLSTIASQLSMAIQNANLYREVQAREELRGELLHQVVSAQEQERQRIARELHDETGQALTALALGLAAASESVQTDPSRAARQLAQLKSLSTDAIEELHELVADLRPSILDDLELVLALRHQVDDFESRTDVEAEFEVMGRHRRVEPEIETVLFRIAQEALTNIAKHARAEAATVRLTYSDDAVQLIVQDDGQGFDPDAVLSGDHQRRRAWGLLGIQERVELVGGDFEIDSDPGAGTTIRVNVPLTREGVVDVGED